MSQETNPTQPGMLERLVAMLGLKPSQLPLVKLLIVGIAVGVLFINAGSLFGLTEPKAPAGATPVAATTPIAADRLTQLERDLSAGLEQKLSLVDGAGKVSVWVTLESGPSVVPIVNTRNSKTNTTEKLGTEGSSRETEQTQTEVTNVTTKGGSTDALAVMKENRAQIAGVLIVASGARDATVRLRMQQAAMTALRVPAHRISVMPAQGR